MTRSLGNSDIYRGVLTAVLSVAMLLLSACSDEVKPVAGAQKIVSFPETIDKNCRGGRAKTYDECSDQLELFKSAQSRAKLEGKTLLVSYGAEWCIWCHVFDAYIQGRTDKFTYWFGEAGDDYRWKETMYERTKRDVSTEARDLNSYVSDNFVVVHIDYEHSPAGDDVLALTDAREAYPGSIPFVFTVDDSGKFIAAFDSDAAEVRRDTTDWYRGYDRVKLLEQLKSMNDAFVKTR